MILYENDVIKEIYKINTRLSGMGQGMVILGVLDEVLSGKSYSARTVDTWR